MSGRHRHCLFVLALVAGTSACSDEPAEVAPDATPEPSVDAPPMRSPAFSLAGITESYETTRAAWKQLLDTAVDAGVTQIHLQPLGWGEAESTPGQFNFSDFTEYFAIKGDYDLGFTLDIGTPVGILRYDLPSDLTFTSFADPVMVARYRAYVTANLERFPSPSHVILHTETATTLLADDPDGFAAYCALLADTADLVRTLSPGTRVGIYSTQYDTAAQLAAMGSNTDFFSFGYNADRGDDDHRQKLEALYALAGDRPIGIHELGIPTAARMGGSTAAQVEFVNLAFDLAEQHRTQLEFMSYYQAFDEDPAVTSAYIPVLFPDWTPEMQADAIAWFGSLGLHTFEGVPKPAWEVFKSRVAAARR